MRPAPRARQAVHAGLLAGLVALAAACPQGHVLPRDPDGKLSGAAAELCQPLVEDRWAGAIVVALVTPRGVETYAFGHENGVDGAAPTIDTRFELGSLTKVFTALALARLVQDGTVALDARVATLLPAGAALPAGGEAITLEQLATHTSGLPRLPTNFDATAANPADPYAAYTREALEAGLAATPLATPPGQIYAYSNLGAGLLGAVLASQAGTSYDALIRAQIATPLGLSSVGVGDDHLAAPRDLDGGALAAWHFTDALAGAGALRSSVRDLAVFARAVLDPATVTDPKLRAAIELTWPARYERPGGGGIALGWHLGLDNDGALREVRWHNGGTAGGRSFMAIDRATRVAIIVVGTTSSDLIDGIGLRLLRQLRGDPGLPLGVPRTITLAPAALDAFVGTYLLGADVPLVIVREGDALFAQAPDAPRVRLWPITDSVFMARAVNATLDFRPGFDGLPPRVVLQHDGQRLEGVKQP